MSPVPLLKPIGFIRQELSAEDHDRLAKIASNAISVICKGTILTERILIVDSMVREFEELSGWKYER